MKEIQLHYQPVYTLNTKNKLKPSGEISGLFLIIGTFKGFVLVSSKSKNQTFLIKLYRQAVFSEKLNRKSILNRIIKAFDNLSNLDRAIVMEGYNINGTINKQLN